MEFIRTFGPTLVSFWVALVVAQLLIRHKSFSYLLHREGRYATVDGLRGFLAISVFFQHCVFTWHWKVTGEWLELPDDLFYFTNYGKVGVAIFFMITGFLFIPRILERRNVQFWFKLYESRVFRIYPLYLLALVILSAVAFARSNYELQVAPMELAKEYIRFGLFLGHRINDVPQTTRVIAGVDWTLKYEWFFYLSLPILGLIITRFAKVGVWALLILSVVFFFYPVVLYRIDTMYLIFFAVGGLASYLHRQEFVAEDRMKNKFISVLTLLAVIGAVFYPTMFDIYHVAIISLFFILVALGNDLFGVFSLKSSALLGEISYSIYLLHGVILYFAFTVCNVVEIRSYSLQDYLLLMPILTVVLVLGTAVTFLTIEKPGMDLGRKYIFSSALASFVGLKPIRRQPHG